MKRNAIISRQSKFTLVSNHETQASAKIAMQLYDAHSYVHDHNDGKRGRTVTYRCAEHHKCERFFRIRIVRVTQSGAMPVALEVTGSHSGTSTGRKKNGIHPAFIVEVDAAAMGEAGPMGILNGLKVKYSDQAHLARHLPSRSQIKSRKGYLMGKFAEATQINTFADLYEWASLRMCMTEARFFNERRFDRSNDEVVFSAEPAGVQNEVLVLNCFDHRFEEDGATKKSFGLIFTTRRVFRSVLYAVEGQQSDGVFAAADGTYKLHYGMFFLRIDC